MPHNCRGTCIFQPMTCLTKIDTLSYLIKEPKPVTPVQVPNNMRVRLCSDPTLARLIIPQNHLMMVREKGKEKKKGNTTCKPVSFKTSFFFEGKLTAMFPACHPSRKLSRARQKRYLYASPKHLISERRNVGRCMSPLVFKNNLDSWINCCWKSIAKALLRREQNC